MWKARGIRIDKRTPSQQNYCVFNIMAFVYSVGLKTNLSSGLLSNGTPSSMSLTKASENSLKKTSESLTYLSTCFLNSLSLIRTMSVGSIIKVLVVLSVN